MNPPFRIGRALVEFGLLAYLLEIPFARDLEPWVRDLPLLFVSVGLVAGLIRDRQSGQPAPPFELKVPALVFLASFLIPIAASVSPGASLDRSVYLPIAFLAFFGAQYAFIDAASFRRLSWVLTGVLLLIGIEGSIELATEESILGSSLAFRPARRVRAGLPHPNDLSILVVLLPIALASLHAGASRWSRAAIVLALPLAAITIVASQSRNTWIGLACAVGVLLVWSRLRKPLIAAAAVVMVLGVLAWNFDVGNLSARVASLGKLGQDGRIGVWLSALEMFKSHPWLGIGPNLFAEFYLDALDQAPLPVGYAPERTYMPWAHNLYLEALAERGVVGLVGLGVLLFAALRRVVRALRRGGTGVARDYAVALAASWTALLVMGLFDLTFLKDWVLLVFLVLVALSARLATLGADDGGGSGFPGP